MVAFGLLLSLSLWASVYLGILYFYKTSEAIIKRSVWVFSVLFLILNAFVFFQNAEFRHTFVLEVANLKLNLVLGTSVYGRILQCVVAIVGVLVLIYSTAYMHSDAGYAKYFSFLWLFLFIMTGLCLAQNLVFFYVFWELVGLSSYLLIGFWYQKPLAYKAAKKAFLINRIGDAALAVGIILFWNHYQDLNFLNHTDKLSTTAGLLLFCGTMAKSAQFPLQTWLPDAMEGPTPVSALIHAATMVAAGVYLLVLIFPYLNDITLAIVAAIGAFSMLYGGVVACFQTDIKRQLAFSTMSQLGLMVLAVGFGSIEAAMFHLTTHAFFKAGLFLVAGVLIHHFHTQNMAEMKASKNWLFLCHVVLSCALAGVPFFSGFLSKESIVSVAVQEPIYLILILINTFITAFYISKQWISIYTEQLNHVHFDWSLGFPVLVLTFLSFGFVYASDGFHHIHSSLSGRFLLRPLHIPNGISVLAAIIPLIGLSVAYFTRKKAFFQSALFLDQFKQNAFQNWAVYFALFKTSDVVVFIDSLVLKCIDLLKTIHQGISQFIIWLDVNLIDGIVNKIAALVLWVGKRISVVQNGPSTPLRLALGLIVLLLLFFLI